MKKTISLICLVVCTFIWGTTFIAQDTGMDNIGPFTFNSVRFFVGFLTVTPFVLLLERKKINEHAKVSYDLLKTLRFPKNLSKVAEIAGGHHEQPCGKGYPKGLKDDEITIEMRILAISDIFEALTAGDRPYKKGKKLSEATKILGFMAKDGEIDGDLLGFFYDTGLYKEYAKENLQENQMDFDDIKRNF